MKKITIRDIARRSGCSAATVSRVLNGRRMIAPETRARVEEAVRALHYRHAAFERRVIAVIYPVRGEPPRLAEGFYVSALLNALSEALYAHGFPVAVIGEHDLGLVTPDRFAGAVSITYTDRISEQWSREQPIPLVLINEPRRMHDQVYSVFSDEQSGVGLAVDCLVRHGHRRISFLPVACEGWTLQTRIPAFRAAMERHGLAPDLARTASDFRLLFEPLGALVHGDATAIIVSGEGSGHRVLSVLSLFKQRVPEDISLVTWEAANVSECCLPPLTTVRQDFAAIGERAAECLEAFFDGQTTGMETAVPYILTERDSVRPPKPSVRS
ncbi:MAG: LacI family DNA-binding transcriptional regulator [Lentisphaeria bacterium]|nr:LacI family DNA-binding transcriptional regulator [Lentisphaeria bacterium]